MTQPIPQPAEQERAAMEQLVVALAYAQTADGVGAALLVFPGVLAEGVRLLFTIPQLRGMLRLSPQPGAHAAVHAMNRVNLIRRAAYLTQAARRVSTASRMGPTQVSRALVTERRYLRQHLAADAGRTVAADQVAAVARIQGRQAKRDGVLWNGLLGWYAVNDALTSPECRAANGRNFDPMKVPPIGFPGSVHPACRCQPGSPWSTDRRVEKVKPEPYNPNKTTRPRRVSLGA